MVREARREDLKHLVSLALELWSGHTAGDLTAEFTELLTKENDVSSHYHIK